MLAVLMGFNYKDPRSLEEWALNHSADHDEIRQAIRAQNIATLPEYQLYPVNWHDWQGFALRHQLAHNEANEALGIGGADLQTVDFNDPKQAAEWHFSHFAEHLGQRAALKI